MLIKRLAFKFGIICSLIKNALEDKKIVNYVTNDLHRKSSLFYNNSARHWQHECDTSNMSDTRDTSSTRVKILILIMTLIKTYFHVPILAIWQIKDHKERSNFFLSKNYFLEMSRSHAKMCLKSAPQSWILQCQNLYQKVIH